MLMEQSSAQLIFSPIFQAQDTHSIKIAIDRVFSHDYTFLRPFYDPTWSSIKQSSPTFLMEREWIKTEIENFVTNMDRGLIIIEGEPGTGKTTFLANLTYLWSAVNHFSLLPVNFKSIQNAKNNLGAQLIRLFGLVDWVTPNNFPGIAKSPHFLDELLHEFSRRKRQINPDQKIFIIIDGFDIPGKLSTLDILGITREIPESFFIVFSQTPDQNKPYTQSPTKVITLEDESPQHFSDLHLFCSKNLESSIDPHFWKEIDAETCTNILLQKSKGNWLVLSQLLALLKNLDPTTAPPDRLSNLPENIPQAYLNTLLLIKDIDHADWYRFILPVLGVLASFPEPISRPLLFSYAGLSHDVPLDHNFDKLISGFLITDFQERYQFNHPMLKALLSGKIAGGDLSEQEAAFLYELVENTTQYHQRFTQNILSAWGGIKEGLPGLRNISLLKPLDSYGLDYLPLHLEGSGLRDELRELFILEWQSPKNQPVLPTNSSKRKKPITEDLFIEEPSDFVNSWYFVKQINDRIDGYLEDILRAWQNSSVIEDKIRYALTKSSVLTVLSQANSSIPIADQDERDQLILRLLTCLAESGDPNGALESISIIFSERLKNLAYAEIVKHLPSQMIPSILRICQDMKDLHAQDTIIRNAALRLAELSKPVQALELARHLSSETSCNDLLAQLARKFREINQFDMALEAVHYINNENTRVELLVEFSKDMDREALQVSISIIKALHDQLKKALAISKLAPYLPNAMHRECLQSILLMNEEIRSKALTDLIPYLREPLLKEALSIASDFKDENLRAPVLVAYSIRTAAIGEIPRALRLIHAILGDDHKANALSGMAPFMTEDQRNEALGMIPDFTDVKNQTRAYEGFIPYLNDPILNEILQIYFSPKTESNQLTILTAIAKRYIELGQADQALEILERSTSQELRARLIASLAPFLPDEMKRRILVLTQELNNPEYQAVALSGLLPHLSQTDLLLALPTVLKLPTQGWLTTNYRSDILRQMIPLLAAKSEVDSSLFALLELEDDDGLSKTLPAVFAHLPDGLQGTALSAVHMIQDPMKKVMTWIGLAPYLPDSLIDTIIRDLGELKDEELRAQGLIGYASRIPPGSFPIYLKVAKEIQEKTLRTQVFNALVPYWLMLPVSQSILLFGDFLHDLSNRSRPDFFIALKSFTPVITDLGGISALKEIIKTIEDITKWWK